MTWYPVAQRIAIAVVFAALLAIFVLGVAVGAMFG